MDILKTIITACAGVLITGLTSVVIWKLNRQAAKEDKKEEKQDSIIKKLDSIDKRFDAVDAKFTEFDNKIEGIQADNRRQDAVGARVRILRFGDECSHGIRHSKDMFDQTLMDIDSYESYCDEHPAFKNSITESTTRHILALYDQHIANNDFL